MHILRNDLSKRWSDTWCLAICYLTPYSSWSVKFRSFLLYQPSFRILSISLHRFSITTVCAILSVELITINVIKLWLSASSTRNSHNLKVLLSKKRRKSKSLLLLGTMTSGTGMGSIVVSGLATARFSLSYLLVWWWYWFPCLLQLTLFWNLLNLIVQGNYLRIVSRHFNSWNHVHYCETLIVVPPFF